MQRINSIRNSGSGRALTRRMFTSQMSVSKSESTACGSGGGGGQPPSADGEIAKSSFPIIEYTFVVVRIV